MFFQRFYLGCLAHASYMIADERTKIAAVVDPQRVGAAHPHREGVGRRPGRQQVGPAL